MSTSWSTVEESKGKMVHRRVLPPEEVKTMLNTMLMVPEDKYTQDQVACIFRMVWGQKDFKTYPQLETLLKSFAKLGLAWAAGKKTMYDSKPMIGVSFETEKEFVQFEDHLKESKDPLVVTKFLATCEEFKAKSASTPTKRTANQSKTPNKKARPVSAEKAEESALNGVASLIDGPFNEEEEQLKYDLLCLEERKLQKQLYILKNCKTDRSEN
jgi:hypothetical protein